ncbi:MAG TPA: ribbon-helix-helix domain-containing protein [Gammaproteobacteria bacterium]|nr:ribbon-helix-helix domain-containing protein [Gammaproteobacteria bacterium]
MGKTKLTGLFAHLEPEKAAALKELSLETRIPRSALVREAIDMLLAKYGKLKAAKSRGRKD